MSATLRNKNLIRVCYMVLVSLLVKVFCVFPKLGDLLLTVFEQYEEEMLRRSYNEHTKSIDDWMYSDDKTK